MATILLVEDEENQQLLYQMELEDRGHQVVLAADGDEALHKLGNARPDLVIMDLCLPGTDGFDALEWLHVTNPGLPVIIYSGYEQFGTDFVASLADAYVVKSSNLDILTQTIDDLLSEKSSEQRSCSPKEHVISTSGMYTSHLTRPLVRGKQGAGSVW